MIKARAMVQKSKYLHIFFLTKKGWKKGGSSLTLYDLQQLGHGMSKLGYEKWDKVIFFHHEGSEWSFQEK